MEKTPLQLLWEWVDANYPNFNKADIEEKIEELIPVERDAIAGAWDSASGGDANFSGEQYYKNKYGETE